MEVIGDSTLRSRDRHHQSVVLADKLIQWIGIYLNFAKLAVKFIYLLLNLLHVVIVALHVVCSIGWIDDNL